MPLPTVWQQDALHVRMPVKLDAEHIENLALQPVGARPDSDRTGNALAIGNLRLHPNAFISCKRIEYPNKIELFFALRVMNCCNIHAEIELLVVSEDLQNLRNQSSIYEHVVLPKVAHRFDPGPVRAFELRDHR